MESLVTGARRAEIAAISERVRELGAAQTAADMETARLTLLAIAMVTTELLPEAAEARLAPDEDGCLQLAGFCTADGRWLGERGPAAAGSGLDARVEAAMSILGQYDGKLHPQNAAAWASHVPDDDGAGWILDNGERRLPVAATLRALAGAPREAPGRATGAVPADRPQGAGAPDDAVPEYVFDVAGIFTVRVSTGEGVQAARRAVAALASMDFDAPPCGVLAGRAAPDDAVYELASVAPAGRPYLVHAAGPGGHELKVHEDPPIPAPITDVDRGELAGLVAALEATWLADSNDSEHEAGVDLACAVRILLAPAPAREPGPAAQSPETPEAVVAAPGPRVPGVRPGRLPPGQAHGRGR